MPPSDVSIGLQEIVCHFDKLEDPRSTINRLHPLPSVLTIATKTSCEAFFIAMKENGLQRLLIYQRTHLVRING